MNGLQCQCSLWIKLKTNKMHKIEFIILCAPRNYNYGNNHHAYTHIYRHWTDSSLTHGWCALGRGAYTQWPQWPPFKLMGKRCIMAQQRVPHPQQLWRFITSAEQERDRDRYLYYYTFPLVSDLIYYAIWLILLNLVWPFNRDANKYALSCDRKFLCFCANSLWHKKVLECNFFVW